MKPCILTAVVTCTFYIRNVVIVSPLLCGFECNWCIMFLLLCLLPLFIQNSRNVALIYLAKTAGFPGLHISPFTLSTFTKKLSQRYCCENCIYHSENFTFESTLYGRRCGSNCDLSKTWNVQDSILYSWVTMLRLFFFSKFTNIHNS